MMQIIYHWHYLLTFVPSISSSLHNIPEQNIPLINIIFLSRNNIYYYINYTTWKTDDVRIRISVQSYFLSQQLARQQMQRFCNPLMSRQVFRHHLGKERTGGMKAMKRG